MVVTDFIRHFAVDATLDFGPESISNK